MRARGYVGAGLIALWSAACHGDSARKTPSGRPAVTVPSTPPAELRSAVTPSPCPSVTTPGPATPPTELRLTAATTTCPGSTPESVCQCLARDQTVLGDGFSPGASRCELAPLATATARVALVTSLAEREGIVAGLAYVLILRDKRGWAARGIATSTSDIDLAETPQLTADASLVTVREATFADGSVVWVQTTDTENDRTADEVEVSVNASLMLCAASSTGEGFHCGGLPLGVWEASQGVDGTCRTAVGSSFQVVQTSGAFISYQRTDEAGAPAWRVPIRVAR